MGKRIFVIVALLLFTATVQAYEWREGELISPHGEENPYGFSPAELPEVRRQGLLHVLNWPVNVTGVLIPYEPTKTFIPVFENRLSLNRYPKSEGEGVFYVPFVNGQRPQHKMGMTVIERNGVKGITFACATCHSGQLFGKTIIGMTNRFPGANELFLTGIRWSKRIKPETFQKVLGASDAETQMYSEAREKLGFVEAKKPAMKGLDTSLAHVALSLSHRAKDEYATLDPNQKGHPRPELLREFNSDSKPAVWWNVKYKNKWLLDGSVVSGNPIYTNLVWNEIGRGTDLQELEEWLSQNEKVIRDLTTAVYTSQAPKITDFFPAKRIHLPYAQAGEKIYLNKCSKCHGEYIKGWSLPGSESFSHLKKIETVQVKYFSDTPVKDVGTDPQRYMGMQSLLQLNDLKISKTKQIKIQMQKGYVPPPLVGIWARFPYLHNNSIPSLCELLKPENERVKVYFAGQVVRRETDFDFACNGYPLHLNTPADWRSGRGHRFDSNQPGLSNLGHDFGFDKLTNKDRRNLIQFLQTL